MIAAPWYLFSFGIVVVLAGYVLSGLTRQAEPDAIDPRMSDDEIAETLQDRERLNWPTLAVVAGYLLISVSLLWRLLRWIL